MLQTHAIRLETQTQSHGAVHRTLRQLCQPLLRFLAVAVIQCPACRIQIGRVAQLQGLTDTTAFIMNQYLLKMQFSRGLIAQGVGVFSRQQMQQAAHQSQRHLVRRFAAVKQTVNLVQALQCSFA